MKAYVILLALLLTGCSSPTPKDASTIKLYLQAEPLSLDSRIGGDRRSQVILHHFFE